MEALAGALGAVVLLLGLALATVGLYGMLRRPEIFEQLHAAGLITGPGVILVLLASLATGRAEIITSALLVVAFVLITSSLSTHAIALAAWRRREGAAATQASARAAQSEQGPIDRGAPPLMRVLVAHDGSAGADVAISLTATMPWPAGSVIRLIGVVDGDLPPLPAPEAAGVRQGPTPDQELTTALEAAAQRLQRPGLSVDTAIRRGDPATAIVDEAESFGADLVVVGSRGLGALQRLLVGSVATAVIDGAKCPVLVARLPGLREVLLAVDGSAQSGAATEVVARWPVFAATPIRVLSIATAIPAYGDPPAGSGMREVVEMARHQRVADAATRQLLDAGRTAIPYARSGDAAARIVGFAQSHGIDLIVVGSRERTGLRRALLGSVGQTVLSSTAASVLVVPTNR